ncbi:transposase [Nitrosomonas cryotolerans]
MFNLHVHLVFVTKYRRNVFSGRVLIRLLHNSPVSAITD